MRALKVMIVALTLLTGVKAIAEPMVVKHLEAAYSGPIRPYLYDVLESLLKITEADYGPYRIEICQESLSAARAKLETEKGDVLNVLFSAGWGGTLVNPDKVDSLKFPAFNDLLGLRSLVVSTRNGMLQNPPESRAEFLKLAAGQGYYWEDVTILRQAGVEVVEAQTFDALFPMLDRNRFDYIPLSVLEVNSAVRKKLRLLPNIAVLPGWQIFYPMDFNLYVSKEVKGLSKRLNAGLKLATPAMFEEIFQRHFPNISLAHQEKKNLFIASNPSLDEQQNQFIIERFLDRFGERYIIQ